MKYNDDPTLTRDQKDEITAGLITDMTDGMTMFALEAGRIMAMDPAGRGLHRTVHLPEPVKDGFGEFTRQWIYTDGCNPGKKLTKSGVGEITIQVTTPAGNPKIIAIGKTPAAYDSLAGGRVIRDAGEPGQYLAVIHYPDNDLDSTATDFKYLDEADVQQTIRIGDDAAQFGLNPERQRQIGIHGEVTGISGFFEPRA